MPRRKKQTIKKKNISNKNISKINIRIGDTGVKSRTEYLKQSPIRSIGNERIITQQIPIEQYDVNRVSHLFQPIGQYKPQIQQQQEQQMMGTSEFLPFTAPAQREQPGITAFQPPPSSEDIANIYSARQEDLRRSIEEISGITAFQPPPSSEDIANIYSSRQEDLRRSIEEIPTFSESESSIGTIINNPRSVFEERESQGGFETFILGALNELIGTTPEENKRVGFVDDNVLQEEQEFKANTRPENNLLPIGNTPAELKAENVVQFQTEGEMTEAENIPKVLSIATGRMVKITNPEYRQARIQGTNNILYFEDPVRIEIELERRAQERLLSRKKKK